jgi:hypothetical protein
MTDRVQFEAMLEALINEDQETAKEIFHNIVVAKSREIYEELLSEDFTAEEANDAAGAAPAEEEMEEEFGADDADDADDEEGDDSEDPMDDEEGDDMDMDMGDEEGGDMEDRVMDLEDALEDLKAEFEQLLADEGDDMGGDDMGAMDMDGGMDMEPEMDEMPMMEYVNKVGKPTHGDNGVNTRSAVAGKNDMGGTTANIAKSFSTEKGGTQGGLANPSTKEENFGNINVPGGNAGKTGFKKKEPGHGAEKKGSGDNGDKSAGSLINGLKSRAK